jgi:hypothetical protein
MDQRASVPSLRYAFHIANDPFITRGNLFKYERCKGFMMIYDLRDRISYDAYVKNERSQSYWKPITSAGLVDRTGLAS